MENINSDLQRKFIERIGVEKHKEGHALALEACLCSFELCINNLRPIQAEILKMRNQIRKKLMGRFRKKFKPNYKTIAIEGRAQLDEYWKEHATPILMTMQERNERLQHQLTNTNTLYEDLAEDGYVQLAKIIIKHSKVKNVSRKTDMYPIVEAWKALLTKLTELLQDKERLLPAIELEMRMLQQSLHNSLALT